MDVIASRLPLPAHMYSLRSYYVFHLFKTNSVKLPTSYGTMPEEIITASLHAENIGRSTSLTS